MIHAHHSAKRVNPALQLKLQGWRARVLIILLLTGFAVLAARAFYLQGLNTEFLQAKGEARFTRVVEMPASRGPILDRNGVPLAISTPVESIWISPSEVELTVEQKKRLAKAVELDVKDIDSKIADADKTFVWLKRQLSPEQAAKVMALKIPGVFQQREFRRFYPQGEVMAHVIGFTGMDDNGQEGIELALQQKLAGQSGSRRVIKDRRGRIVEDIQHLKAPRDGAPLTLSIDHKLQYIAHKELKDAVAAHRAKGGAAVVLDARTGEVLALVNQPDYNPNNRASMTGAQTRNRSVTDVFEPGSTFKPFAVAAALQAGTVKRDTVFQTGSTWMVGTSTITDAHPSASMTVAEIIQKSSNIGTAKMALQLPSEQLWTLYSALGFGSPPQTGFPGEASGRLRAWKGWRPIEQATMSYGYGLNVSLLQLARAYTLFTNNGQLLPVTFQKRSDMTNASQPIGRQVITPQTAELMSTMLETVMQPGGTATKGQVPGYRLAGKTGTARKLVNGRYVDDQHVAFFCGYGPVSDPRFIIAVSIDEPSAGKYYGGDVAAPVFAGVMAGALRNANVPPDAETSGILRRATVDPAGDKATTGPAKERG